MLTPACFTIFMGFRLRFHIHFVFPHFNWARGLCFIWSLWSLHQALARNSCFNIAVGFLANFAFQFKRYIKFLAVSQTHIFSPWWCLHCVPWYIPGLWDSSAAFSWLVSFNSKIPLMLWKLSGNPGIYCKMHLSKCQKCICLMNCLHFASHWRWKRLISRLRLRNLTF